jgi:hypothetical protein
MNLGESVWIWLDLPIKHLVPAEGSGDGLAIMHVRTCNDL